jgi:hypothetical protein
MNNVALTIIAICLFPIWCVCLLGASMNKGNPYLFPGMIHYPDNPAIRNAYKEKQ